MTTRLILAAIFAVLTCAVQGDEMAHVNFDDWYNARLSKALGTGGQAFDNAFGSNLNQIIAQTGGGQSEFSGANDPELKRIMASELVGGINGGGIPAGLTPDQILDHFRQQGGWESKDTPGGLGNQLKEFGSPIAWLGASALGGPVAGTIAAANGAGATQALGVNPNLTNAIALAYGAYNGVPGGEGVPPSGSAPQNMQLAQAPGTTMTDVAAGMGNAVPSGMTEDFLTPEMAKAGQNVLNGLPPAPIAGQQPTDKSKTNPDGTPAPAGTNPDQPVAPAKPQSSLSDNLKTAAYGTAAAGAIYGALSPRNGAANGQAAADQLAETEQQRQARVQAATDSVNKAFAGYDDPYYQSIADSYKNFQSPLYDEQVTEARRKLPMSVPNTQSSAYLRKARQLETDVQRGQTDLDSQAIQQSNNRRGEIDAQKSDLLNMATAGADASTVADAAGQRAQLYAAPPQFSPIADMFQKYSSDAANFALAQNVNSAGSAPRIVQPLSFARSPSSSQRIVA